MVISLYVVYTVITMVISVPLSFLGATRFILQQAVIDKESKMKETLKILSLKTGAYGLSYFLSQSFFTLLTSLLITITFGIMGFYSDLTHSLQFLFVCLWFGLTLNFYSLVQTTLFSDSKISTQIGSMA